MKKREVAIRYGRLTVLAVDLHGTHPKAECECDCGTRKRVRVGSLRSGDTRSCGCLQREIRQTCRVTHGLSLISGRRPRLYQVWAGMVSRCTNPNSRCWKLYGGRGILVCDEWLDAGNFLKWAMENGYNNGLQIDRIDNSRGYSPDNCRFVTSTENGNNKRNNCRLELKGRDMTIAQWSRELGISANTLYYRYHRGWNADRVLMGGVIKRELNEGDEHDIS